MDLRRNKWYLHTALYVKKSLTRTYGMQVIHRAERQGYINRQRKTTKWQRKLDDGELPQSQR